jgi:hypothetical protein
METMGGKEMVPSEEGSNKVGEHPALSLSLLKVRPSLLQASPKLVIDYRDLGALHAVGASAKGMPIPPNAPH